MHMFIDTIDFQMTKIQYMLDRFCQLTESAPVGAAIIQMLSCAFVPPNLQRQPERGHNLSPSTKLHAPNNAATPKDFPLIFHWSGLKQMTPSSCPCPWLPWCPPW